MKFIKQISVLVLIIAVSAVFASLVGLLSAAGPGEYEFTSIRGQTLTIYGRGIYGGNTVSAVLQAKPQDIVTLFIGVPLLLISLIMAGKGRMKGKLLLTGVLGYFVITYFMYTFIAMYNRLFLVYVILMSASFFAFVLSIIAFDINKITGHFTKKLPVQFIGSCLVVITSMIALLWLSRVLPSALNGSVPPEVEHGTTLPVQAFDLALFLPVIFLSGLLIIKRRPEGYLLAPAATFCCVLIMTALLSKGISMALAGIPGTKPMIVMVSLFDLTAIVSSIMIMKNVKEIAGEEDSWNVNVEKGSGRYEKFD